MGQIKDGQAHIMSRYAGAALIIMYTCTERHHDSAALHHRAMEVKSKKERNGSRRFFCLESIFFPLGDSGHAAGNVPKMLF
ncbi:MULTISPECIES: hypothetical protein [Paenibacillus]|uniref:hypothetical protein n=1 Tax=Paenibacillus TaxID=44249 RepID=UPI00096BD42A|nr:MULTISPECIES: hypothetical protein [Paenibacillus]MXO77152.1 hypothetical protein [Paenibacillus sp. OT2-17]OMF23216.1 hypothetical protein BK134_26910 [Paenibacillus peoriae]